MSQDSFEKRTRELLGESASRMDARTQSRLTQARHAALEKLERAPRPGWRLWIPAAAAASVALLTVMVWRPDSASPPALAGTSPLEDLELLSDAEAPDFFEAREDLEFYEWALGEMES